MALIRQFTLRRMERNSIHKEINATFTPFHKDGKTFLQIDSYGTEGRQIPGKKSQSIQLDEFGARNLYRILKKEFRFE